MPGLHPDRCTTAATVTTINGGTTSGGVGAISTQVGASGLGHRRYHQQHAVSIGNTLVVPLPSESNAATAATTPTVLPPTSPDLVLVEAAQTSPTWFHHGR